MGIGRATSGSAELSALSERISMHAVAYLLAPFRPTDDHRAAFPIVPIGNQIADYALYLVGSERRGRRSDYAVMSACCEELLAITWAGLVMGAGSGNSSILPVL